MPSTVIASGAYAMDYSALITFVQRHFTDGLVLVVGSGLSAAEGIPGMGDLANRWSLTVGTAGSATAFQAQCEALRASSTETVSDAAASAVGTGPSGSARAGDDTPNSVNVNRPAADQARGRQRCRQSIALDLSRRDRVEFPTWPETSR